MRKTVFFRANTGTNSGTYAFKGSYYGSGLLYSGVSVNEMLLIRAECAARAGNKEAALADLNTVLKKRWKSSVTYPVVTASDATAAVSTILVERRKELLMRGLRWMDIKRLNKEGANIVLKRIVNGETYILPPNDPRYALAIPQDVVTMSEVLQNPR